MVIKSSFLVNFKYSMNRRVTYSSYYNNIVLEGSDSMKKRLINYYAVIIMTLFIIYNMVLSNLKINGILYQIIMIIIIIIIVCILIKYSKDIKHKKLVVVLYFLIWLFSKNILQCFFTFSNIIILMIILFVENKSMRVILILITILIIIFHFPIIFIFILKFGTDVNEERGLDDIYKDTHYYCENNYELYSYSAVMDGYHYSVGKYYEILTVDDIIYISYNERNNITQQEYNDYLKSHNCSLVGDKDGYK